MNTKGLPLLVCCMAALSGCFSASSSRNAIQEKMDTRAEHYKTRTATETATQAATEQQLPVLSGPLSLTGCLQTSLRNSLSLQAKQHALAQMEGTVKQATAAAYPQLSLSGNWQEKHPSQGNSDSSRATLELTQPLWRSGAVSQGIKAAKSLLLQAEYELEATRQEVLYTASQAYLKVLLEKQMVEVYRSATEVAERMLTTAQSKRARGTVSDYEVLRAEVEVSNAKAALIKEQNTLETAMVELFLVMGVSQESSVEITDSLAEKAPSAPTQEAALQALQNRPEIAAAHAAVLVAEAEYKAARAEYGPEIDFFGSGNYAEKSDGSDDWEDEWIVGISASFTIFDGFARAGKIEVARAKLEQARTALYQAEQNVLADVAKALMQVRYAEEFYASQKKNIELSQEIRRMAESGFRAGRTTQVEVLDARAAVTEASGAYHQALYTTAEAALRLQRAIGSLALP